MAVIVAGLFKLILAIAGVLVMRAALLWFDRSSLGRDFHSNHVGQWDEANQAFYYSMRFVGAALVVGLTLS